MKILTSRTTSSLFISTTALNSWLLLLMSTPLLSAFPGDILNGGRSSIVDKSDGRKKHATLSTTPDKVEFIRGMETLVDTYDTFLLDMWGVMHNGCSPYPGVVDCVEKLSRAGKRLVILSNSSKRSIHATKMLRKLGFNPDDFHGIWTSGEICHRMLSGDTTLQCDIWAVLKNLRASGQTKAIVLGSGDEDAEYVQSAGWELAYDVSEADILIARGTFTVVTSETIVPNDGQSSGQYQEKLDEILTAAAKLRIPMLICNPDKVRPDESLSPMPGAIGDKYVKQLQLCNSLSLSEAQCLVKRIGKPYQEIYHLALASIEGCSEMARLGSLMVGDALETDVTGGLTLGCNTLWVIRDGIHGAQVAQHEEQLQGESTAYEEAVLRVLRHFNDPNDSAVSTSRMGQEESKKSIIPTFAVQNFRWS